MELKHQLSQVLSPRRYLSKELRQIPRLDMRKEKVKQHIKDCLSISKSYQEFELKMRGLGYEARGIAFVDRQKVRVKGSEVGYALSKIERLLELKHEIKNIILQKELQKPAPNLGRAEQPRQTVSVNKEKRNDLGHCIQTAVPKESKVLEILLETELQNQNLDHYLLQKKKQKRKTLRL